MAPSIAIPYMILNDAWFFIIAHFIMSWLIAFNVLNLHQQIVGQIWQSLNRLLDPIYRPIRQYLPNLGGLDLAPLAALIIIAALQYTLVYYGV